MHYWTFEGAKLIANPAIVLAVGDDGVRLWLHVFWASGAGGRDQVWAPAAAWDGELQRPVEGQWTWPVRV